MSSTATPLVAGLPAQGAEPTTRVPTDWKTSAMAGRIKQRYAAERRFRMIGLAAVLISAGFLAFLLISMIAKGATGFAWNGKDANGATVATGPLRLVVSATGASGSLTPDTATWTQIAGVQSPAGGAAAKLVTGLGLIAPEATLSLS